MEFLSLSRRRSSARNVPGGEERGETDVFVGYLDRSRGKFLGAAERSSPGVVLTIYTNNPGGNLVNEHNALEFGVVGQ